MMAAQQEWPEITRKRTREEEAAALGFEEHRNKRLQTLPFRVSTSSKRFASAPSFPPACHGYHGLAAPPAPHTITPGDSDSEEAAAARAFQEQCEGQKWADCPELVVAQQLSPTSLHIGHDMDMMDMEDSDPTPNQHDHLRLEPGSLQPDPIAPSITGRMPTPIHATFVAQVRGNNWGGAAGNIMGPPSGPVLADGSAFRTKSDLEAQQVQRLMGHESVPRSLDGAAATEAVMADWTMVQNRRLPSPISESGGEDGLASPVMVLDSSSHSMMNQHGHMHPMLNNMPRANSVMELGQQPQHRASSSTSSSVASPPGADGSMDVESPSTPSPRKGHTRSRHTLNSWTAAEPGMKKSFSIGYRTDCEKCRLKVPGHFNHIIIS